MKTACRFKLLFLLMAGIVLTATRSFAQYDTDWTGTTGDFFNVANWDSGAPAYNATWDVDNGGTAIIDTNSVYYSGPVYINYYDLGDTGSGSGNLQINSGEIHASEIAGDSYSGIGYGPNGGSFVMNGGTYYYDGPQDDVAAALTGNSYLTNGDNYLWENGISGARPGVNGLGFYVGNALENAGAVGSLVLHSNSVLRISDALYMADYSGESQPNWNTAYLTMDGNSELDIGVGVEIGKAWSTNVWTLSGNANMVVGNSMGLGNTNGSSNQGYFTLGTRDDDVAFITVKDNARISCLTLQNRGPAFLLLTNNAFFGIYDVLSPNSYNNPLAYTNTLNYCDIDSYWAYEDIDHNSGAWWGLPIFTVAGHSMFVVNVNGIWGTSATWGASTNAAGVAFTNLVGGFSIGTGHFTGPGGINGSGANGDGGELVVKDYGTFLDYQSLHLGSSPIPTAEGALVVEGPNATITIGNELRLAMNLTNGWSPAQGIIQEVITAPTQSTINVANRAWLTNGVLIVQLQGYTPHGGESYNLVSAGIVDGLPKIVDFSAAPLAPGLVWNLTASSTNLVLKCVNTFAIQNGAGNAVVSWQNEPGTTNVISGGLVAGATNVLQSSTSLTGGWTDVVGASSPYTVSTAGGSMFFRLRP